MSKAKILFYDVETSPLIAYTFKRYDTDVAKVKRESELLTVSWRWAGEKKITRLARPDFKPGSERGIVKALYKAMNAADVLVGHNVRKFDIKKANTAFGYFRMAPPLQAGVVDTLTELRKHFALSSNRLGDALEYFKLGKKLENRGIDLWDECMEGSKAAFKEMLRYNAGDVIGVQALYDFVRPWMTNHPNISLIESGNPNGCPTCGGQRATKWGRYFNQRTIMQGMCCNSCGKRYRVPLKAAA